MAHAEEIDAHVRRAWVVFGALMVLTVLTVAVSYLDVGTGTAVALALVIALTKGALVSLYFMHLIAEKAVIYSFMAFTVVFFIVLLIVPVLTGMDVIRL